MFEEFLTNDAVAGGTSIEVGEAPESALLAKQLADRAAMIGASIALAGAAYPVVLALGLPIVLIFQLLLHGGDSGDVVSVMGMMFIGSTVGASIGLIWATLVASAILPLVYLFVRSLRLRGSVVRLGAFCGGLVGFVAVLPMVLGLGGIAPYRVSELAVAVLVGPMLTTVLGQVGGGWGGWRARWYERALAAAAVRLEGPAGNVGASRSKVEEPPARARLQFRIWHLLIVSVWVSVLLTAIRLSGVDFSIAILLLGGWAVFQTLTLWAGGLLVGWIGRWRAGRKSRST
jgi:hypothetical protein